MAKLIPTIKGNSKDITLATSQEEITKKLAQRKHDSYLNQKLTYTNDGRLLDEKGYAVMMEWEAEIMRVQARTIAASRGDILNVGFGMGFIDSFIQTKHAPRTHWIIEAHPDVQKNMIQNGWLKQPHVRCIFAKWQDVVDYLPKFDGIYFDTWEESMQPFVEKLPTILRKGGVFSYFNNPGPEDLANGHAIPKRHVDVLSQLGFSITYDTYDISSIVPDEESQGRMYWHPENTTYYNPICVLE